MGFYPSPSVCLSVRLYKLLEQKSLGKMSGNVQGQGSWVRVKGHVGQGQRSSGLNPA